MRHRLVHAEGALRRLGAEAAREVRPGPCLLVTDRTVDRLHGRAARAALRRGGFAPSTLVLPPGERTKSLAGLGRVLGALAALPADRATPVVALGGGVVCDLAGFAAAVYARGLPWVAVPTTLLAMADAAVGGKTAIDLPAGKNLAGAFHFPRLVLSDPRLLRTLPPRHLRNGLAEMAKMELLAGVRRGLPRLGRLSVDRAARAKAAIVASDPFETRGRRVLLNLGHTVGHALEAATGYRMLHGEAVAVGIVVACRVAERRGLLRAGEAAEVAGGLAALGLPTALPRGVRAAAVLRRIGVDKKRSAGTLRMVLPRSAGRAVVRPVGRAELARSL